MIVPIQFDSNQLIEDLYLNKDQVDNLMDTAIKDLTASFKDKWSEVAANTLHSSREQYIANLNVIDEGIGKGAVVLTGALPNMVESGSDEFDMKIGFLNGPNAKTGKNGKKYNTIPFSFGVPTSQPENFNGGILPAEIHKIVKSKPVGVPLVKDDLPTQYQEPKMSSVKSESSKFKQYEHKSSIYEGLSKRQDEVTKQNSYGSFRRVSENSDPNAWIFPGLDAKNLAEEALTQFDIPSELTKSIDNFMDSI